MTLSAHNQTLALPELGRNWHQEFKNALSQFELVLHGEMYPLLDLAFEFHREFHLYAISVHHSAHGMVAILRSEEGLAKQAEQLVNHQHMSVNERQAWLRWYPVISSHHVLPQEQLFAETNKQLINIQDILDDGWNRANVHLKIENTHFRQGYYQLAEQLRHSINKVLCHLCRRQDVRSWQANGGVFYQSRSELNPNTLQDDIAIVNGQARAIAIMQAQPTRRPIVAEA